VLQSQYGYGKEQNTASVQLRKTKSNNKFTVITMLSYLYDLLMSFVTFILGLFGCSKKSVSFAEDVKEETKETQEIQPAANEVMQPTDTA
jgi:hypothetical protein